MRKTQGQSQHHCSSHSRSALFQQCRHLIGHETIDVNLHWQQGLVADTDKLLTSHCFYKPFHTGFHNTCLPNFNFCVISDPHHFGPKTKLRKDLIDISWGTDDIKPFGCLKHQLSLLSLQVLFWKPQAIANFQGTFCTNSQRRRRIFGIKDKYPAKGMLFQMSGEFWVRNTVSAKWRAITLQRCRKTTYVRNV